MARHVEDDHQAALFRWARMRRIAGGETVADYLYAIPNGGKRNAREAARMKAQGVKAGVSDVHLPLPAGDYHGLWLELKAPKPDKSSVSQKQKEWIEKMNSVGHRAVVCFGWQEARDVIESYLTGENDVRMS